MSEHMSESRAFRYIEEVIDAALNAATSAQGRAILDAYENANSLLAFDTTYNTRDRKKKEIDLVRQYLNCESTDAFERIKQMLASYGISVTPTKGKSRFGKHMVTAEYDGVPYSMEPRDGRGGVDPTIVPHNVLHYNLTIERHHEPVKAVYEYLKQNKELGDIWVMMGGGSQLQAFYGNKNGYLGILYLTLERLEDQERLSESGYLAACGNESFTLVPQGIHYSHASLFKDMKVPGVNVRGFGEADDDDEDEE